MERASDPTYSRKVSQHSLQSFSCVPVLCSCRTLSHAVITSRSLYRNDLGLELSNYHCEASPYYCAVGEEWWDPFKTAEDGLHCHFSSVARYDDLNEKHIESTRTIDSTTKIREDLTFPEVGHTVPGVIPGIVNLSNAYANSPPSAELTKKSLRTQPAFPKAVQHNQHVTPSIQGDENLPKRGACIDSNQSDQST